MESNDANGLRKRSVLASCSSALSDIKLLLKKNYIIQLRHPWVTLIEVFMPCLLVLLVAILRTRVDVVNYPNATIYKPFNLMDFVSNESKEASQNVEYKVMYTPNSSLANEVMRQWHSYVQPNQCDNCTNEITLLTMGFDTTDAMLHYYMDQSDNKSQVVLCGLEFIELNEQVINFQLRFPSIPRHSWNSTNRQDWKTNMVMFEIMPPGPREKNKNDGGTPGYAREGFLFLQHTISIIASHVIYNKTLKAFSPYDFDISFESVRFPYASYREDNFLFVLNFFLPSIILFSAIYSAVELSKTLVHEKEKRLKESMKMMGLKEKYHWIAHFIRAISIALPSIVIKSVLLVIQLSSDRPAILNCDLFLLILFFILYEISNICMCFMLSTFFSKANLAAIFCGIIFFLTILPYYTAIVEYNQMSITLKLLHCLLPNTDMALGLYNILMRSSRGVSLTWSNINEAAVPNDSLTMLMIMLMSLLNSTIYLIITWYATLVFPGEYGVPLPWYFPFSKNYWFKREDTNLNGYVSPHLCDDKIQNENVETYPSNLKVGISIQDLLKTYDNGKTYSVKNLSLNTFYGQITALLGHNGAGKTTTISILVGLFKPSAGTALINGYDIRHSRCPSLGVCPQFNVLFEELTVEEHLVFFCKLKRTNLSDDQIKKEVKQIIEKLDLVDKTKVQSSKLSGGMKRKLSVGIALVGDSQIVILDEPTSGMDASARRFLWDLLLQEKKHRSILITTHFMEEADILGDRIAIMANGKLQCYGSPMFLKKRYGAGYHLTISKKCIEMPTELITAAVQSSVPSAKLESSVGVEVTYSLPNEATAHFESLLTRIEDDPSLAIDNYGISVTTMEEVFLKVGDYAKEKINTIKTQNSDYLTVDFSILTAKNQGFTLLRQQLRALLVKRFLYSYRNPLLTLAQILIPFLIVILTLVNIHSKPSQTDSSSLDMSLKQFQNPTVIYFYDNILANIASQYQESLSHEVEASKIKGIKENLTKLLLIFKFVEIKSTEWDKVVDTITTVNNYVYNYQYMISAMLSLNLTNRKLTLTSLFNNQAFHTPAISLKYLDEALIRFFLNATQFRLNVANHPLPMTINEKMKFSVSSGYNNQFQIMQTLILSISFLASSFVVLIVRERVIKAKHLQKVCGLRLSIYWFSFFLVDYLIYIISSLMIIIVFLLFKEEGLHEDNQSFYLFFVFLIAGLALLPWVYILSFLFAVPATAYARLSLFLTIFGIAAVLTDQITASKQLDLLDLNEAFKPIFAILIPLFDIGKMTTNLQINYANNLICNSNQYGINVQDLCSLSHPPSIVLPCCKGKCGDDCIQFEENFFSTNEPGVGIYLIYVSICALIYLTTLIMIEINVFNLINEYYEKLRLKVNKKEAIYINDLSTLVDDDVETEKKRIGQLVANISTEEKLSNPLVICELYKKYGKFTAVNGISYSISKGECFGLLGVNGAGKTTTFKMITGDESITSGDIFINGLSVKQDIYRILQEVGYCPQFDAILEDLTGKETLRLYSRLRGINESEIDSHIEELSRLLYFEMHLTKKVSDYSGGSKRKLSTAIAMLGSPAISFLDEPTSGVDPVARRCLWEAIDKKLKQGGSIVLTSHSMEECEALCNRLVIMVNGQIQCIGSPLHLITKYGNGYTLLIKVSLGTFENGSRDFNSSAKLVRLNSLERCNKEMELAQRLERVQQFVENAFPTSILKAVHNNLLHYTIQHSSQVQIRCSKIFGAIEQIKDELFIEDYSVCQTNLEQIFLSFARSQRETNLDINAS